jgi:hypothetical protein
VRAELNGNAPKLKENVSAAGAFSLAFKTQASGKTLIERSEKAPIRRKIAFFPAEEKNIAL